MTDSNRIDLKLEGREVVVSGDEEKSVHREITSSAFDVRLL
jgi:hypothetical protein